MSTFRNFLRNPAVLAPIVVFSLSGAASAGEGQQATLAELQQRIEQLERGALGASEAPRVYGEIRVSVDHRSADFGAGKDGASIVSNASRLGVKGSMDSTISGVKVLYQAELRYETTDEVTKDIQFRESYAGIKTPLGTLKLGRLSTAYKKTLTKIDPWNDNSPQSRGDSGRQGLSFTHR